jgi:hypothetical protein
MRHSDLAPLQLIDLMPFLTMLVEYVFCYFKRRRMEQAEEAAVEALSLYTQNISKKNTANRTATGASRNTSGQSLPSFHDAPTASDDADSFRSDAMTIGDAFISFSLMDESGTLSNHIPLNPISRTHAFDDDGSQDDGDDQGTSYVALQ